VKVQQKHSDGTSLGEEKACLDCLMTKNGAKWVWKGLADLSTISDGGTPFWYKGAVSPVDEE
jgi:hypothetical protein